MTIEEKSKAYDEALERARKLYERGTITESLGYVFPELAESEDERVRKAIHIYLDWLDGRNKDYQPKGDYSIKDMIAWLEKQGEKQQKTSIWKHWKDGIAGNGEGEPIYLIKYGRTYSLSSCLGFECDYIELSELDKLLSEKQGEQKPTDKVEPKFNVGDAIKITGINNGHTGYSILNTEDGYYYNWKLIDKKTAWSEEDELVVKDIEEAITNYWHGQTQEDLLDRLKSIKQRIGG